jgi:pyruvate kinase
MARTRVVATLGPASRDEATITALVEAGVDVFRLNFSHGTHEEHGTTIAAIRRAAGARNVGILQDLAGPKLRLTHPVSGKPGDVVEIDLPPSVRPGDPLLLADGLMQLEVVDVRRARVIVGGDIPAGKGMNLPSSDLDIASLTQKDEADLRFGVEHGVDAVGVSFVRRATDLAPVRAAGLPVIAKIETA